MLMADDILYTTPIHPPIQQGTNPQQTTPPSAGIFGGSDSVFDTMHENLQPIDTTKSPDGHTNPAQDPFFSVATPQGTKAPAQDTIPFIPGVKPFHPAPTVQAPTAPAPIIQTPTIQEPMAPAPFTIHEPPHPTAEHMIESPF